MEVADAPRAPGSFGPRGYQINWGNVWSQKLAFFFMPTGQGYVDLVRGDVMLNPGGPASKTVLVRGPAGWGWFMPGTMLISTRGGDPYYGRTPTNLTIMAGGYNPVSNTGGTNHRWASWTSNAGTSDTTGTLVTGSNTGIAPAPRAFVGGGGGTNSIQVAGANATGDAGRIFAVAATYNGATLTAIYQNDAVAPSTPFPFTATGTSATRVPAGLDRILLGSASTEVPGCAMLWIAGWFTALPSATVQAMWGSGNLQALGRPPAGLLSRRRRIGGMLAA